MRAWLSAKDGKVGEMIRNDTNTTHIITKNPRSISPRLSNQAAARKEQEDLHNERRRERQISRLQRQGRQDIAKLRIILGIIFVATIVAVAIIWTTIPDINPEWIETTKISQYIEVNVRESPGGSVIGTLHKGEEVRTTGRRSYFIDLDGRLGADFWAEIMLPDGRTAWIIGSAVL